MSAQRFAIGTQFRWQDVDYEVKRLLPDNKVNILNLQTGEIHTVQFIELFRAICDESLQFLQDGEPVQNSAGSDYLDLADIPPHLLNIARHREEIVLPLLDLAPSERKTAIDQVIAEVKGNSETVEAEPNMDDEVIVITLETAVSVTSVYRWIANYEKSGRDVRSLVPNTGKRGGKGMARTKDRIEVIVQSVIEDFYFARERRTHAYIHREIAVRVEEENRQRLPDDQLKCPGISTIRRRVLALDKERVLTAKKGKRAAKRELTQYGHMEYPNMPLERVEIDHTLSDLIVVDDGDMIPLGRLTVTYCVDTATRYPLGIYLGFEPPSYLTVLECLYHAILPKPDTRAKYGTENEWLAHGIPYNLVIDNGKEFISKSLQDSCALLGISLQQTPVMTPHLKAAVERMFGTINTGLLHTLPGTTFSNIWQRGDYKSLRNACIKLSDLDQMMNIFLVDIYAQNFHRGLKAIPAKRWEALTEFGFFPRVPSSAEELRILLGRMDHRTVQPYGIEFKSLRYNSSDLTYLRTQLKKQPNKRVKLKYHPGDISRIYVFNPFDNEYIEVPALAQEYTHELSLWKHEVILNEARKHADRVDIVALGRAQRKIQEIVDHSLSQGKKRTHAKEARWQQSGSTPSLDDAELSENGTPSTPIPPANETVMGTQSGDMAQPNDVVHSADMVYTDGEEFPVVDIVTPTPSPNDIPSADPLVDPLPSTETSNVNRNRKLSQSTPKTPSAQEDEFEFDMEELETAGWGVINEESIDFDDYDAEFELGFDEDTNALTDATEPRIQIEKNVDEIVDTETKDKDIENE